MLTRLLLLLPAVLLCVAGPVLAQTADRSIDSQYAVCNTACCNVQPNCSVALHVTCRCDRRDSETQIHLRRDSLPPSVETIDISGVDRLELRKWALLNLTSLSWVKLQQIGSLIVHKNGVARRRNASLATINIFSVTSLYIESGAFSGYWDGTATINIDDVTQLSIDQNAFSFQSTSGSPTIGIERVPSANVSSGAFNASFSSFSLKSVNITQCGRNTFGKMMREITMDNVDMHEIREDCIEGTGVLNQLSVVNSRLGIIRHRGIHGNISSVSFLDTDVKVLEPNGLQLHVDKLDVTTSYFNVVMQRGFHVLANRSICLHKVNVTKLHRNAFQAMQVAQNPTGDHQTPMLLHDLTVSEAENGSLAFDKETPLDLVRLSVRAPEPPVCPVSKWVRQLTGLEEMADLGPREQQIQDMLDRDWLCTDGGLSDSSMPVTVNTRNGVDWKWPVVGLTVVGICICGIVVGLAYCSTILDTCKNRTYQVAQVAQADRSATQPNPGVELLEVQTDSITRRRKPKSDEVNGAKKTGHKQEGKRFTR